MQNGNLLSLRNVEIADGDSYAFSVVLRLVFLTVYLNADVQRETDFRFCLPCLIGCNFLCLIQWDLFCQNLRAFRQEPGDCNDLISGMCRQRLFRKFQKFRQLLYICCKRHVLADRDIKYFILIVNFLMIFPAVEFVPLLQNRFRDFIECHAFSIRYTDLDFLQVIFRPGSA